MSEVKIGDVRLAEIQRAMVGLEVSMEEAVILLVLHRYGQQYEQIRPELATLEAATGLSRRGVQAALGRLKGRGFVTITRRVRTSSVYRLSDAVYAHFMRALHARTKCARSLEISSPVSIPSHARTGDAKGSAPSEATGGRAPSSYQSARRAQEGRATAEPPRVVTKPADVADGGLAAAAYAAAAPRRGETGDAGNSAVPPQTASVETEAEAEARVDAMIAAYRQRVQAEREAAANATAPAPSGTVPDSGGRDGPRIGGLGFG